MTCRTKLNFGQPVCDWYDDSVVSESPETCHSQTNREACEGIHADYPIAPSARCAWAVETVYARGESGCEPMSTRERCVAVDDSTAAVPEGQCTAPYVCQGESQPVYWNDLAGDITLLKVDSCMAIGREGFAECEFGDPTVPTVCDCACGGGAAGAGGASQ
jgi:hypothetical protein